MCINLIFYLKVFFNCEDGIALAILKKYLKKKKDFLKSDIIFIDRGLNNQ